MEENKEIGPFKQEYIVILAIIILLVGAGIYFSAGQRNIKTQDLNPEMQNLVQLMPPNPTEKLANGSHRVTLKTDKGDIVFETYNSDAPKATLNFLNLAKVGYYNNVSFHRVIPGFMIQGGDPTGTGRGSPGYQFEDELDPKTESFKAGYAKGVVAMANSGPNTNGSQFFIMLENTPLENKYTIFGKVVKGQEVVDAIGGSKRGEGDKPLEATYIREVQIENLST